MRPRIHEYELTTSIQRTTAFEKKGLALFSVNPGTKCGHDCLYCSTGSMNRMHESFKTLGENPFEFGYAIVDPLTPDRVAERSKCGVKRGLIQLCTTVDAWSPEAQKLKLGRRCLEAILEQPGWTVRILTKNAAVMKDFDLIEKHRDRVLVGISITAPASKEAMMKHIEPYASPMSARMNALQEAHRRGLRTYGMLCPLFPGIANRRDTLNELVDFSLSHGAEEIFAEPINSRGKGLGRVEEALRKHHFISEADAVAEIRHKEQWSGYTIRLIKDLQAIMRSHHRLNDLRFLLYPANLTPANREWAESHQKGVRWLEKEKKDKAA